MEGLYSRLFKYRSRPDRSPLEDFLTEAWVDLLIRIPTSRRLDFCTDVLLKNMNNDQRRAWRDWVHDKFNPEHFSWQTQVGIGVASNRVDTTKRSAATKRPDIVLFCDDKPVMILENKIGAGFTYHEQYSDDNEAKTLNQLHLYGEWLRAKSDGHGALILLTAWTPAPTDFDDIGGNYGVAARSVVGWSEVHKQLITGRSEYWPEGTSDASTLVEEFTVFMEEQGVIVRDPEEEDLNNAVMFFGEPYRRFWGAIENVGRRIGSLLKQKGAGKFIGPKMNPSGLWLDQYVSFDNGSFWIGWGVRAKTVEGQNDTTAHLFAYVYTSMNADNWDAVLESGKFSAWDRPEPGQSEQSILLREIPVSDLISASEGFSSAFWHWVNPDGPSDKRVIAEALKIREFIQARRDS